MKSSVTDFDRNLRSINTKVVSNKARQVNTEFSRLHYNGSKSFLCANRVKIRQFTGNASKITPYSLNLGNILKYFSVNT